ncbi:hypothetical protein ROS62_23215 [Streptomyces sp. DSM 41972]|uniref:Uncharacterized protein n=1 Tax=Streptomyces althioticus subsp. attaecolombicae TaxID=3075534 RepID=A0ABU3I6E2_9ACTN|nr:hypothetical protein [Streptomyces sp. DSM 41972]
MTPDSLREEVERHRLVNLTGPLGIGKSYLAARIPSASVVDLSRPGASETVSAALAGAAREILVLDNADGAPALAALEPVRTRRGGRTAPVLVVSRRSLLTRPGWTGTGVEPREVPAWDDERIRNLAVDARLHDARSQDLVVRLAAGNPLIAGAVCRALHTGAPPTAAGAVAHHVAREITDRLSRERPAGEWRDALPELATVRWGDEELLGTDPALFGTLGTLSVVTSTELGLGIAEPFRTVIETAHRWRRPATHRGTRSAALAHRQRLLAAEDTAEQRSRQAEGIMALSPDDVVREALFAGGSYEGTVHTAAADDADTVGALMHAWARSGGMDTRRTDRLVEQWLRDDPASFQLFRDGDGRAIGLASTLHVAEDTIDSVEPLLQQHTDRLLGRRERPAGWLLGAAYCPDRGAHSRLLRHLLRQVIAGGLLLTVSTPSPHYQGLLRALRFRRHGPATEDVYRCGRKPEIYSQDFGPQALPVWTEKLAAVSPPAEAPQPPARHVAQALADIGDPDRLAGSPLLSLPHLSTVTDLRERLREAVHTLEASDSTEEAEAGWILAHYYLGPRRTHLQLARSLHLSRATYFRRLRHGLDVLGRTLASGPEDT